MSKHLKYGAAPVTRPAPRADGNLTEGILTEIRDRIRRLETRTTKYLEAQGFDTGAARAKWLGIKPGWEVARIDLPTPAVSLKEILATIPKDHEEDVDLYVGEELIATIYR